MVKKGDTLFTIDQREYDAALLTAKAQRAKAEADLKLALEQVSVRTAEAEVDQNKARLRKAEQDVARLRPLAEADAVPKQDLDNALAAQDVATADLKAAESRLQNSKLREDVLKMLAKADIDTATAAIAQAELNIEYCTITTPMDGMVGRAMVSVGNLVGRGESTLLATVSTVEPMRVTLTIPEAEYLRLRKAGAGEAKNAALELTLADGTVHPEKGKFAFAERAVDLATGTLTLESEFPNPNALLRPGQFGRVRVIVEKIGGAVMIPRRAVMEQQSAKVVYVVGADSKVEMRMVQLGERDGDRVVVREGVKPGEKVVVEGQAKARPGQPVTIADASKKDEKGGGEKSNGEKK